MTIDISISIVSHGQIDLVAALLEDLKALAPNSDSRIEVILTLNLPENLPFSMEDMPFPVKLIHNVQALGFAANHNQAFRKAAGQYYAVVNPDIRLSGNPFTGLIACLASQQSVGLVAPRVFSPGGSPESSARFFPTPWLILRKLFGHYRGNDYPIGQTPISPDWVAGMFMLFPSNVFASIHGFDQRYFLYYEDVDICARLRRAGHDIKLCPQSTVIHDAQYSSHRNLRYLRWHLTSMLRFFLSDAYRHRPRSKT